MTLPSARRFHAWLAALGLLTLLAASPAWASKPASMLVWINWPPIKQAAQVFPPQEVADFTQAVEKVMASQAGQMRESLPAGFSYVGGKFVLGNGFYTALERLVLPSLTAGDKRRVEGFFAALNNGRWVRGYHQAGRGQGGGKVVVKVSLGLTDDGRYALEFAHQKIDNPAKAAKLIHPTQVKGK
jgi:hypothetical protein